MAAKNTFAGHESKQAGMIYKILNNNIKIK